MRITMLLPPPDYAGGIRVIATYADRLSRRGHDVVLVHPPNPRERLRRRVKGFLKGKGWRRYERTSRSHIDDINVTRRILDSHRPIAADDVPDADVVVATWWQTAEWVAALPRSKGAKAYFVQHHEVVFDNQPVERVQNSYRLPLQKIVVAQWLADLARTLYGDDSSVLVPNSVDVDLFRVPPRAKNAAPTAGFVYAGFGWKGSDIAAAAIEEARRREPSLRCVAFGAKPPDSRATLPGDTAFHLCPPQELIPRLYASADVWLVASRTEGFGLPLLEAMACGTPFVGTPTGAAPELVRAGGGLLVPHEDPKAMADALLQIATLSPTDWKARSDQALAIAHSYSWNDATTLFEQALYTAIDRDRQERGAKAARTRVAVSS